jgi:DNA-binding transcriptional LysR family regulator
MKNLPGLVSFAEAAAVGSFTAAAAKLDLTPAAVSKNVLRLEQQLGVRLFNRSTRQLQLTAEGKAFSSRVGLALRTLDEAVAEISQTRDEAKGRVRISVGVSFGRRYLMPLLPALTARYPQLQIEVSLENRPVDLVAEGFDIGVRGGVLKESSLVARRIAKLPLILVASPTYLRLRGTPTTPAALNSHDLLGVRVAHGNDIPWRFRKTGARGFTEMAVNARLWVSDPEALIDLALLHAGIAQIGLHHAMSYLRSGRLKAVLTQHHDAGDREIVLHYPHRQYLAPRVRVTVDALLQQLGHNEDLHAARATLAPTYCAQ